MTQGRLIFSNPTPSEPHLSPAATMSDDMLSAPTLPLHCECILQPTTPPQVVAIDSWTISAPVCLNCVPSWFRLNLAESPKPDLRTCVHGFTFSSSDFAFLIEMDFSFESLFAIWSLLPQRFNYYFNLSIGSWQYQKYWTILILCCACCVQRRWFAHLTQALPRLYLFSAAGDKGIESHLHTQLFSEVLHRRRGVSPRWPIFCW